LLDFIFLGYNDIIKGDITQFLVFLGYNYRI
jgi:hypothetical protein